MEKNVRYPIEAFAVACVLFSTGMKEAMIAGIAVVFGHVLLNVLLDNTGSSLKAVGSVVGGLFTAAAVILLCMFAGLELTIWQKAAAVVAGVLVAKHGMMDADVETDYNDLLLADALAYAAMVIIAIVREFISTGAVYTITVAKHNTLVSEDLGKAMIAIAFTGIALGIVNQIADSGCAKNAGLFACVPIVLLEAPFVTDKAPEAVAMIIGMVIVLVVFMACRTLLKFSDNKENMEGVPVEMVLLGLLYLIVAVIC